MPALMPRSVVLFLIFSLALPVYGQQVLSRGRIADQIAVSNYTALISELESSREKDPRAFDSTAKSYLLARIYEKSGDLALAAAAYNKVSFRDDGLERYAIKHMSRIARNSGNLALERVFLRELAFAPRPNLASVSAPRRLAFNSFESGDYAAVIGLIGAGFAADQAVIGESNIDRGLQTLLARTYFAQGDFVRARSIYEELIETSPEPDRPDDYSQEAVKGLDLMDSGDSEASIANLSATEHRKRADIYQFNRDFQNARLHYTAIVESSRDEELVRVAIYQIARGYTQERKDRSAVAWFEKLRKEYPDAKLSASALYGAAGSYANLGETEKAVRYYSLYIDGNDKAGNLERAYLNIVDAYRDAGNPIQAVAWSRKAQARFKGEVGEAIALFAEARTHIASEEWNPAEAALNSLLQMENLGGPNVTGGTNESEIRFLKAFVLQKLKRDEEAKSWFRKIQVDFRDYYGWRADDRLRSFTGNKTRSGSRVGVRPKTTIAGRVSSDRRDSGSRLAAGVQLPAMQRVNIRIGKGVANTLLEIGLFDEAAPETEIALLRSNDPAEDALDGFDVNTLFTLAEIYSKGGFADRAVQFIEPHWKKVPRGVRAEQIPRGQAELLYPVPFRDSLLSHGAKHDVDPRFLLSIMRQESRYRSDIKSVSAARGLMQFVHGTSAAIADELRIENFDQDDLYDPDTAIRFGAKYISNIFRDFPAEAPAVAASYNGGEDRMARWMKRSESTDQDRYVPEIVFAQTKDYTYRVISNYHMYRFLYDKNLIPRKQEK